MLNRLNEIIKRYFQISKMFYYMIFRKSILFKLLPLIIILVSIIIINMMNYYEQLLLVESEKSKILNENTYKIFFVSAKSENYQYILTHLRQNVNSFQLIDEAFIYMSNLYIDFLPLRKRSKALKTIYDLFNIKEIVDNFFIEDTGEDDHNVWETIKIEYIDYNGLNSIKGKKLNDEIFDAFEKIVFSKKGNRIKEITTKYIDNIQKYIQKNDIERKNVKPLISDIELIIPKIYHNILINCYSMSENKSIAANQIDNNIIFDSENYFLKVNSLLTDIPYKELQNDNNSNKNKFLQDYLKKANMYFFPKYYALYVESLIIENKEIYNKLLFPTLTLEKKHIQFLQNLHFNGNYLYSYIKLNYLEKQIETINDNTRKAQFLFWIYDSLLSLSFPFIISLFGYIYLKKEIAYILFHKSYSKYITFIFYLYPLFAILSIKIAFYIIYLNTIIVEYVIIPQLIIFIIIAILYWILNRLCFNEFLSNTIRLNSIFKGK